MSLCWPLLLQADAPSLLMWNPEQDCIRHPSRTVWLTFNRMKFSFKHDADILCTECTCANS